MVDDEDAAGGCAPADGLTPKVAVRRRGSGTRARDYNRRRMASAGRWLLVVAGLFLLSGTWHGIVVNDWADRVAERLAQFPDEEVFVADGVEITVGEYRAQMERTVLWSYGVDYALALVMGGLWFLARPRPVLALVSGAAIYIAVLAVGAILAPGSILALWYLKVFIIAGLFGGARAALAERRFARDPEAGLGFAAPRRSRSRAN